MSPVRAVMMQQRVMVRPTVTHCRLWWNSRHLDIWRIYIIYIPAVVNNRAISDSNDCPVNSASACLRACGTAMYNSVYSQSLILDCDNTE